MPATQLEINAAFQRLLEGDDSQLALIRDAFDAGELTIRATETQWTVRAAPPAVELGGALERLRQEAGAPMQAELAERLGVSTSSISRILAGQRAGNWPTIYRLIEVLDGNPANYRDLWEQTR